jgi:anthranilate synthase component 2
MRVLIIDNHDSFVYNLAQYVGMLGHKPIVYRSNNLSCDKAKLLSPDRIIISPGPGHPSEKRYFGCSSDILESLSKEVPTLGVCLGHQGIISTFGGILRKAPVLKHGKTSRIYHDGKSIFKGLKNPIIACRYHSLVADTIPSFFKVTALSLDDGQIMGIRHREFPIEGVQFHPESILTEQGLEMVRNFLENGVTE